MITINVDDKKLVLEKANPLYLHNNLVSMEKILLEVLNCKGSTEELEIKLTEFDKFPLACDYMFARYYLVNQNYVKAEEVIERLLLSLEKSNEYFSDQHLGNIYATVGQIYGCIGHKEKSIKAFQDYQLCLLRVRSDNVQEGLLSFRRVNEFSLADLINNEITVCSPRVMNDPYDSLILKWGEFMQTVNNRKAHIDYLVKSFESYRIRSFAAVKDEGGNELVENTLMWSHYADNHTGFCVKYCFSKDFIKTEERHSSRFKRIKYGEHGEKVDIKYDKINSSLALCTKHNYWKYENEVRLISYQPDFQGPFYFIPLDDKSYIDSIYFGYKCSEKNIKRIREILSRYNNIKYFKMSSDFSDIWKLSPIQII